MDYEAIIGLEIHAEMNTKSKMFCRCKNDPFHSGPNENICPVCLGFPGVLPVFNKKAIEWVMMAGLAMNCKINMFSKWDRKNYYYPDLPKGYQISQYDLPLAYDGFIEIGGEGGKVKESKKIGITRIHLEEDTGKLIHPKGEDYSLVDYNRSSVPLMELVTEPDIRTGTEAKEFAQELQLLLRYLDISKANMEKGEMRVEVNISVRKKGNGKFGTKVEVKNLNSFTAVERSIDYEIKRQVEMIEAGDKIVQETRGWNEDRGVTFPQRVKETAMDYRYFPEPDLPPIEVSDSWLKDVEGQIPELPRARRSRYRNLGLNDGYATMLVGTPAIADYFEKILKVDNEINPSSVANWLLQEKVNLDNSAENFAEFVTLIDNKTISSTMGKDVLKVMNETLKKPNEIIEEKGLRQITNTDEILKVVEKIIEANSKAVEDYRSGKVAVMGFLVGQAMRETRGQAEPGMLKRIFEEKLNS